MRTSFPLLCLLLLASFGVIPAQENPPQEKPKETPPAAEAPKPAPQAERKNPVKPTPEGLATAKKVFGYDCAMCHNDNGDGKGDLAASMSLSIKDLRDPATLAGMSDGELFDLIQKGKGKMIGEGDRVPAERIWNLVNYVRSFAKKEGAEKPQEDSAKP